MKNQLALEMKQLINQVTEKEIKRNKKLKAKTRKLKLLINALSGKGERNE